MLRLLLLVWLISLSSEVNAKNKNQIINKLKNYDLILLQEMFALGGRQQKLIQNLKNMKKTYIHFIKNFNYQKFLIKKFIITVKKKKLYL